MTYAFTIDASACSGCKACQVACKDKNNLPVGVLWRRVFEVSGGSWEKVGDSWVSNVFAYNLTIACNHCGHPKCAGVCPVNAYLVRDDGIVLLDSSKCIGCGYCNWACPYCVPQYDAQVGIMTKCNFCFDNLEAGEPPACVAACPMRVLDYGDSNVLESGNTGKALWVLPGSEHPYPLPNFSRTQPHVFLKPHPAMFLDDKDKAISNCEETRPQKAKNEFPLVIFTLLAQLAVGIFWAAQWLFAPLRTLTTNDADNLHLLPQILVCVCLALGVVASFAHLGQKKNVWRILSNLKKSWLSREVLFVGLFGAGCLLLLLLQSPMLIWATGLASWGLIFSMSSVYKLRSMPAWNSWRTLTSFVISSILLGQFFMLPVLFYRARLNGIELPFVYMNWVGVLAVALLSIEVGLVFSENLPKWGLFRSARVGLILLIMSGVVSQVFIPPAFLTWFYILLFVLLSWEEMLGRLKFYAELDGRTL